MRWTAVHTKPRCEKILAKYCGRHGIPHYLPLRRRAARYQRRTVVTLLPMFPGYLFAQLGEPSRALVLRSHRAVAILPVEDSRERQLIDELREVLRLESACRERDVVVAPELVLGVPVLIRAGALAGLRGIVTRRSDHVRVTINVELLGQSASVELDVGEIEPVSD